MQNNILGLNLRNIIWHGFVHPFQVELHYISFLFVLYLSVARIIKESSLVFIKRPLKELSSSIFSTHQSDYLLPGIVKLLWLFY